LGLAGGFGSWTVYISVFGGGAVFGTG